MFHANLSSCAADLCRLAQTLLPDGGRREAPTARWLLMYIMYIHAQSWWMHPTALSCPDWEIYAAPLGIIEWLGRRRIEIDLGAEKQRILSLWLPAVGL